MTKDKQRDLSSQDGSQDQQQFNYVAPDDDEYQNTYRVQPFAEGISEYDEYQQAWRFLGFMVDCNAKETDDDNQHDGGGSNSYDGGTGEGCKRYLLWAAYVDLEYEGGGIGEYQYYNIDNNAWDKTSCNYAQDGNSRCAKMDCHLDSTHFSLLGFFKHQSYDDWMEQLFKHEGVCVWGYNQYSFMNSARNSWPQGCADSGSTTASGKPIYTDLKPISKGGMSAGLYTDTKCTVEYQQQGSDDPNTVENILGNFLVGGDGDHNSNDNGGGGDDYGNLSFNQAMSLWEYGFEHFKVCQPCVAYNLNNVGGGYYDDDANQGGDNFDCYDQADYTNVNQCMKFMAKTSMNTATFRDLSLAQSQGTLVDSPLAGFMDSRARSTHYMMESAGTVMNYVFLAFSVAILFYGVTNFWRVRRKVKLAPKTQKMDEPLVFA
mmetsp:Transcript_34012/g.82466  ORF Transcript_34012/g.82466 Transcript_34012/m.82466 type:complete len:431 (-) Transcript_34012:221-1513(-)